MYPVATGITSMSDSYIPAIWSKKTIVKFYEAAVVAAISNTDYTGEIKAQGDRVEIRVIPDIITRTYQIGQKLIRTRPETTKVTLYIDKGEYYSIPVNLVEMHQADIPYIEKWTDDAGQQMKNAIEVRVFGDVYADASADNCGLTAGVKSSSYNMGVSGTPLGLDKTNIFPDWIVDIGCVLDEQNVPDDDRFLVLPTVLIGMLKKSDIKDAAMMGDGSSVLRSKNGRLGIIDRFELYKCGNITTTADGSGETAYNCIAGHKSALTFASQLVNTRTIPNPDDFGDIMEGLQVYGYKVIKPESLVHAYVYKI